MSQEDWKIKSVSLSPVEVKILESSGMNFSKFVRGCLRRHDALNSPNEHRNPAALDRLGICPPNSQCFVCYPDGKPTKENWMKFLGRKDSPHSYSKYGAVDFQQTSTKYLGAEVGNREWLLETIEPGLSTKGLGSAGNHKSKKKSKKGLIRRFLAFIY